MHSPSEACDLWSSLTKVRESKQSTAHVSHVLSNKKLPSHVPLLFIFHMACQPDGELLVSWIHRPQMGDPQSNPGHAPSRRRWEKARLAAFCSSLLTNWSRGPGNKLYSGGVARCTVVTVSVVLHRLVKETATQSSPLSSTYTSG